MSSGRWKPTGCAFALAAFATLSLPVPALAVYPPQPPRVGAIGGVSTQPATTRGPASAAALARFTNLSVNGHSAGTAPASIRAGGGILVQGMGWALHSVVAITLHSTPVLLDTPTAADLASIPAFASVPDVATAISLGIGGISDNVIIPADTPPGAHTVEASGVDPSGRPLTLTLPIYVVAASTATPSLASTRALSLTGFEAAGLGTAAGALIVLGALLLVAVRRSGTARATSA